MRVGLQDQLKLDGRLIRQRRASAAPAPVFICHRSPGEPLLPPRAADSGAKASATTSMAARLPRRSGLRFISVSPMPAVDGGLELLTADGAVASRLRRAMRGKEMEFSLRAYAEEAQPRTGAGHPDEGMLDRGTAIRVVLLSSPAAEASNRWYRLIAVDASGNEVRQLIETRGRDTGADAANARGQAGIAAHTASQPLARTDRGRTR